MAEQTTHNLTLEEGELERLLENEENYCRMLASQQNQAAEAASGSASSTATTPGPLDTAFLNETNAEDQHGQISLSAAQSQTIADAASTVYRLIDTMLEQQAGENHSSGSARTTMVSTGTMTMTPVKMASFGTMPRTPTATASIGTTPTTPTPLAGENETIDLRSPTVSIIDLVTPNTPTNTGSPH